MYIIFGKEAHDRLQDNYTLLEVDPVKQTQTVDGPYESIPAYCVITGDHVPLSEVSLLETIKLSHAKLIEEYRNGNKVLCKSLLLGLRGKFKGEMDTFYDEIEKRLSN
jgi:hypothetical protein